jgi:hypothetical protein
MKSELILITTEINGEKRFVRIMDTVAGRHIVECMREPETATNFSGTEQAERAKDKIHNLFDRLYSVETIIVDIKPIGTKIKDRIN